MILEEKLKTLRQHENWWSLTEPQRRWLTFMAEGHDPLEATKKAYPDAKNGIALTKSILARVGIQDILETIGLDFTKPNITKREALKYLSRFMRLAKDASEFSKLLTQYAKLQGWEADDPSPTNEQVSLDDLVAAAEKKRKQHGKEN